MQCNRTPHKNLSNTVLTAYDGIGIIGQQAVSLSLLWNVWSRRKEFSILQVHDSTQILSVLAAFIGKISGIPTILYQGMYRDFLGSKRIFQKLFEIFLYPILFYSIDKMVAKTSQAAVYIGSKASVTTDSISIIHVGLDVQHFSPTTTPTSSRSTDILYVGKLEARRNPLFIAKVLLAIKMARPSSRFTIIGDGPCREEFLNVVAPLLADGSLTYINKIPNAEISIIYNNAKLLLSPTSYEIYGMTILEAMYHGTIPLTSPEAGPSEIITQGIDGQLISDYDVETWTNATITLLNNPVLMDQLGKNARSKISEHFLWEHTAKDFASLYDTLIKKHNG